MVVVQVEVGIMKGTLVPRDHVITTGPVAGHRDRIPGGDGYIALWGGGKHVWFVICNNSGKLLKTDKNR